MSNENTTIQLIRFEADGRMEIKKDALAIIESIKKTLAVLIVVGPMRTGKSYILSQISKKLNSSEFTIDHGTKGCTKGLWINKKPIDLKNGSSLILVDCQVIVF